MEKITIVFYRSSSKYYSEICSQCGSFEEYTHGSTNDTLIISICEIRNTFLLFKSIFNTISNWSRTQYYLNGIEIDKMYIERIMHVIECAHNYETSSIKNEFCYCNSGWGCSLLNSIELRNGYSYGYNRTHTYWYDFGNFVEDKWKINYELISKTINEEARDRNLSLCEVFDIDRIQSVIENLPEFIEVNENSSWEYKYRAAPVGMEQTEIIGVKPKNKGYGGSCGLSINLSGDNDSDYSNEDSKDALKRIPDVSFSDIGGIDDIVEQVREVIELPIIAQNIFQHYNIKPHKGILLYGPPGCGKTLIAKAIAHEIQAHFIAVNGPEILNKFVGQSEANLRSIFEEARRLSPSIIYFDEFDSISATRDIDQNPLHTTVVNQLLTLMDGLDSTLGICVIASTNRIDIIDEAIKRPGRFDYKIEVQKPTIEGCKSIFHIHTDRMPVDNSFDKDKFVENNLTGLSGADIAFVVAEAAYNSIRRTVNIEELFKLRAPVDMTEKNRIIDIDFHDAVSKLKTSILKSDTAKFRY